MSELTWDTLKTRRAKMHEDVVHRALAQETVLLNVSTSTYYAIDEVGGRFLETMISEPSLEAASEMLAAEYEQPIERIASDMVVFCKDLLDRKLLALEDGRG
jgi:hypothetical protein